MPTQILSTRTRDVLGKKNPGLNSMLSFNRQPTVTLWVSNMDGTIYALGPSNLHREYEDMKALLVKSDCKGRPIPELVGEGLTERQRHILGEEELSPFVKEKVLAQLAEYRRELVQGE